LILGAEESEKGSEKEKGGGRRITELAQKARKR
jgi:hypothetical protein